MRLVLAVLISLSPLFVWAQHKSPSQYPQVSANPKVEASLSVLKTTIAPGEPVMVRIQVRNLSNEPIFLPREFHVNSSGDPGLLEIGLQDAKGKCCAGMFGAADRAGPPREDFFRLVFEYWTVVPPGYWYGADIDLTDSGAFNGTLRPGHYRITARYSAYGMSSENMNNPLGAYLDRVSSLPYVSWDGVAECKPVWIEVISAQSNRTKSNGQFVHSPAN